MENSNQKNRLPTTIQITPDGNFGELIFTDEKHQLKVSIDINEDYETLNFTTR